MVMRGRKLKRHGREVVAYTIMSRDQGKVELTGIVSVKCQSIRHDRQEEQCSISDACKFKRIWRFCHSHHPIMNELATAVPISMRGGKRKKKKGKRDRGNAMRIIHRILRAHHYGNNHNINIIHQ